MNSRLLTTPLILHFFGRSRPIKLFHTVQFLHNSLEKKKSMTQQFFQTNNHFYGYIPSFVIPEWLNSENSLKDFFCKLDPALESNYLHCHFRYWLHAFVQSNTIILQDYLKNRISLNEVCQAFINFCFSHDIYLDAQKTLASFDSHNHLSTTAVKQELAKISTKKELKILGYGLDAGDYEKELREFLLKTGRAEQVTLFGFDPYAQPNIGIKYLSANELSATSQTFDIITARWVLHHVELKQRWADFIKCINRCQNGAQVLIIEHGFIDSKHLFCDKKIHDLLNATFDVVANIGLRPQWLATSKKSNGKFFIDYLTIKDLEAIKQQVSVKIDHMSIHHLGPRFPNQTICKMRIA